MSILNYRLLLDHNNKLSNNEILLGILHQALTHCARHNTIEEHKQSACNNNTALYITRRVSKVFKKLLQNVPPIMYDANDTTQYSVQKRRQRRRRDGVEGPVAGIAVGETSIGGHCGSLFSLETVCAYLSVATAARSPSHISIESLFRTKDFRNEMIIDEVSDPLLYF